ncbi:autophagy- protein 2, partial [Tulasnella sp. 403]
MVSFSDLLSFTLPSISLPAIPLPANIQRRFLSFLLRRTLGHLVKPGQLDISQIEAQIGDGRVEIKDVELDPQAINLLLDDLPLELREGAIGKVAAQIPLPNIFTAPFALSLSSLHLTFLLRKPPVAPVPPPTTNLAESVTSVAETFLHDELTERENRIFRESVQGGVENPFEEEEDRLPPGSINPYLEDDANEDTSLPHEQMEDDGVGMLAMLVERLLARFSFAATDIQIRIVHPSETEYTLLVPEVAYATEEDVGENILKVRTVRVSGVTFSVKDVRSTGSLRHVSSSGSISSETEGVPSAVESSSEDDVPMSMYQSTASLRTSTMYHSTTSSRPQPQNPSDPPSPTQPLHRSSLPTPPRDEVVFSLASEPIVVRINNVFPAAPTVPLSSSPLASSPSSQAPLHMSQET